jgi:hypothetical protein
MSFKDIEVKFNKFQIRRKNRFMDVKRERILLGFAISSQDISNTFLQG